MRYFSLIILFFTLIETSNSATAQDVEEHLTIDVIPDWVDPAIPDRSEFDLAKDEPVSYYVVDRQARFSAAEKEHYFHYVERLNTSSAVEENSTVKVNFDPEYQRVVFHSLKVWRDDVARDLLDPAEFQIYREETERDRLIYNGALELAYLLPDVRIDDVVEYSFSVVGKNPAIGDHFHFTAQHAYNTPVRFLRYRVLISDEVPVYFKSAPDGPELSVTSENGYGIYLWQSENQIALDFEKHQPQWFENYPLSRLTSFRSWSDVGAYFAPFYSASGPLPDELRNVAQAIRAEHEDDASRARAALAFVQREIRYLGIELGAGGYIPRSPEQVLSWRFGDCKDMVVLLNTLLGELGIDASPLLVDIEYKGGIENLLPSYSAFDHVITVARIDGMRYFLDPTRGEQTGDLYHLQQGEFDKGVVISANSPGMIDVVPKGPEFYEKYTDRYYSSVENDDLKFESTSEYFMAAADDKIRWKQESGLEDIERSFLQYYQRVYPGLSQTKPMEMDVFEDEGRVRITASYLIPNGWDRNKNNPDVRTLTIRPEDLRSSVPNFEGASRITPFALSHPVRVQQELQIELDDSWDLTEWSDLQRHPAFSYTISEFGRGTTLHKQFSYKTHADFIAPEDFSDSMNSIKRIINNSGIYLTEDTAEDTYPWYGDLQWVNTVEKYFLPYYGVILIGAISGGFLTRNKDALWRGTQEFYPVSLLKFVTLNVFTLGIYYLFWVYKNWQWLREVRNEDISPIWRTIFSGLTNYFLFRHFSKGQAVGYPWFGWLAAPLAILILMDSALNRYIDRTAEVPDIVVWISLFNVLLPLPAAMQVLKLNAQNKEQIALNSKFSWPVLLMMFAFFPIVALAVVGSLL